MTTFAAGALGLISLATLLHYLVLDELTPLLEMSEQGVLRYRHPQAAQDPARSDEVGEPRPHYPVQGVEHEEHAPYEEECPNQRHEHIVPFAIH